MALKRSGGHGNTPAIGWTKMLKHAVAGFSEDRVMAEAAGVTFYALLAFFPAIAAFISIYGLFSDPSGLLNQLDNLGGILPGGGIDIIKNQIIAITAQGHKQLGFAAFTGLAISLWSANSGMKSLFDALNFVYHDQETRSYVRRTLISFAFTLGAIAFVIAALTVVVVIPLVMKFIGLSGLTAVLLTVVRWPVMMVMISLGLSAIYRYGPSRTEAHWQWISWGGATAAVVWVGASLLFSFYVAHFGSYNKTYGSLGAVAGFMTWIWMSSIVVLMGAELNATLEQHTGRA